MQIECQKFSAVPLEAALHTYPMTCSLLLNGRNSEESFDEIADSVKNETSLCSSFAVFALGSVEHLARFSVKLSGKIFEIK